MTKLQTLFENFPCEQYQKIHTFLPIKQFDKTTFKLMLIHHSFPGNQRGSITGFIKFANQAHFPKLKTQII